MTRREGRAVSLETLVCASRCRIVTNPSRERFGPSLSVLCRELSGLRVLRINVKKNLIWMRRANCGFIMQKYVRLFFKRISNDLKQKKLLPVKFLFFIQMSTILVLYPYLTIHMRELGINVEETAIMSAVTPVIGIFMPPLAGVLADKIGNFRLLLASFSALGGLSALLLLLVPIGRVKITYPDILVMEVSCYDGQPLALRVPEEFQCDEHSSGSYIENIPLDMVSCGFSCENHPSLDLRTVNSYKLSYKDSKNETFEEETIGRDVTWPSINNPPPLNHKSLKLDNNLDVNFRRISGNNYFFPSKDLFHINCGSLMNRSFVSAPGEVEKQRTCRFSRATEIVMENFKSALIRSESNYEVDYVENSLSKFVPVCAKGISYIPKKSMELELYSNVSKIGELNDCEPKCIATSTRKKICGNQFRYIDRNIEFTFWTYLAVRVFIGIIGGTSYTMFEGAVIAILREYRADYGLQRVFASFGGMISSPLSGWLIDYASQGKEYTDFRPVFFLYAFLKIVSSGMMMFIDLKFKVPAKSVISDVMNVMSMELSSIFVAAFLLGSAWGYIESFLFWLLQDLGGSKSLMGLTITVGGLIGIPILVLSGPLIKRLGHANVIFIGFVTYAVRLLGYSVIYNPWLALIFEALECFTHSLCFTAAVTYAAKLSTVTTDTTIQGIFGGLFYGVGKSCGSLIGGYLINVIGMRSTFQVFSVATGVSGLLYVAFYHLYMKSRSALVEPEVSDEPKPENENKANEIVEQISSIPYEDGVTNVAYQETEEDVEDGKVEQKPEA